MVEACSHIWDEQGLNSLLFKQSFFYPPKPDKSILGWLIHDPIMQFIKIWPILIDYSVRFYFNHANQILILYKF